MARARRSPFSMILALVRPALSLFISIGGHVAILGPYLILAWWNARFEETPGEEGQEEGPTGDAGGEMPLGEPETLTPISVSLYTEPAATVIAEVPPTPGPGPTAKPPAPPAPKGSPDGSADAQPDPNVEHVGVPGHKPRGNKKPCDPFEEITSLGPHSWRVERDVVDWFATHLNELDKQVGVASHRGADGKPDGARIFLPRCSVLRDVGIRNGDIVNTVNGRQISTLPEAVAAYLTLRTQRDITVEITRRNGERVTHRYQLVK